MQFNFQQYASSQYIMMVHLLMGATEVPRENHRPAASHWQTLSHKVVSSTPHHDNKTLKLYTGDRIEINLSIILSWPLLI